LRKQKIERAFPYRVRVELPPDRPGALDELWTWLERNLGSRRFEVLGAWDGTAGAVYVLTKSLADLERVADEWTMASVC
jgi:hypothetical protein